MRPEAEASGYLFVAGAGSTVRSLGREADSFPFDELRVRNDSQKNKGNGKRRASATAREKQEQPQI
jgi:hypothetical protein